MFVKPQSKQRFGESKTPFVNLEQVCTVELGHDGNAVVKLSNGDEWTIPSDKARQLLAYVEKNQLQ